LEYAYNDFGIGLVAKGLGKADDMDHYFNKSGDWFNLWNPDAANSGFSGFIQPRNANGSWYFDPRYDLNNVFRPDHCSPVFGHFDCFLVGVDLCENRRPFIDGMPAIEFQRWRVL
jgi:hypothetical protein